MQLRELLDVISPVAVEGSTAVDICALVCDSRQVSAGAVFFALPGSKTDGRNYITQAIAAGAVAIIADSFAGIERAEDCCFVQVAGVRRAMARAAAHYYGYPGKGIPVIGITGTNGKTTITYLIEAILKSAGYAPAVFGTVDYRLADTLRFEATHTTPESLDLMRMLAEFRRHGANALVMEVSSHALEQHRADGLLFDIAVFTNLTQDHLDYHAGLEPYFASKCRLFTELLGSGVALINADDPYGRRLLADIPAALTFGRRSSCSLYPRQVTIGRDGIHGVFTGVHGDVKIDSPMIGEFNLSNLLAAVAVAQQLKISNGQIAAGIRLAPQVPGRLERVDNDGGVLALVDYAHTGDALEQVLKTLFELEHRRLYTVVGCGGDRDPGKRPLMAAAAVSYSDLAIFTSDNPRTEDPIAILDQIRAGALAAGGDELDPGAVHGDSRGFVVIPDRRSAINYAAGLAGKGDLLLVAGKGHEDYQILGSTKIHFDDREELQRALAQACAAPIPGDRTHV
ncbi:MAG: UDP-N-acetylmuramoyl-L-alanyl-D-glutamate--2,6-diaminopimelate ligase [Pelovirga sp.]